MIIKLSSGHIWHPYSSIRMTTHLPDDAWILLSEFKRCRFQENNNVMCFICLIWQIWKHQQAVFRRILNTMMNISCKWTTPRYSAHTHTCMLRDYCLNNRLCWGGRMYMLNNVYTLKWLKYIHYHVYQCLGCHKLYMLYRKNIYRVRVEWKHMVLKSMTSVVINKELQIWFLIGR